MILFIGLSVVLLIIIAVVVYFVFFNKTDEERCVDDGNTWDSILKKCKTPKDLCEEAGNTWTDEKLCKTPKDLCEANGYIWDDDQCWSPRSHCENYQELVYTNNGDCITHSLDCTNKGNKWVAAGTNKGCHTPIDYCKFDGKGWDAELKECSNVIDITLKGNLGIEKIKLRTRSKSGIKTDILGTTVVPKTGITKTYNLESNVTEFIIDFTNDSGNRDVILVDLKLNGNDIKSTVKDKPNTWQKGKNLDRSELEKGNLSWGGEYVYPIA